MAWYLVKHRNNLNSCVIRTFSVVSSDLISPPSHQFYNRHSRYCRRWWTSITRRSWTCGCTWRCCCCRWSSSTGCATSSTWRPSPRSPTSLPSSASASPCTTSSSIFPTSRPETQSGRSGTSLSSSVSCYSLWKLSVWYVLVMFSSGHNGKSSQQCA